MKIITWNLDFWRRWKKRNKTEWKNNVLEYLNKLDYDFLLLQEVNSSLLFGNNKEDEVQNLRNINELINEQLDNLAKKPDCKYSNTVMYMDNYKDFVYYQELSLNEIGFKINEKDKIFSWGNSIVTKKKYIAKNDNLQYFSHVDNYCGRSILMFFDFLLPNGKTIGIINFYSKIKPGTNNDYPILEYGINDIKKYVKNNTDNHLILLAGDFNSDSKKDKNPKYRQFFIELNNIGFINCTEEFETTMVPGNYQQFPNDKIFVNQPYYEYVKCNLLEDTTIRLSDHRPLQCLINKY